MYKYSLEEARDNKEVIDLYNQERPHLSCQMKTPNEVHLSENNPLTTLISNKYKVSTLVSN